ncbi:Hypothetical protein KP2612_000670 [Komagataella phaffii]|uniref:Kinetochore protein Sos7 coiled-coil domain-containing protein n=1 Tax=Komagataella phaffii (strain GS115 / ATCC 20864) TaxID=644223 RepID=C4QWS7_KOMPG|nr:Hypothetical protein PAS_chr1-1_0325 [Komagataella phaffii GS115]AOA61411.1 GQ67_02909T0 [Komagataella phaffii]AOA66506.1 GQ68_02338T0 [Komagataella phaffii GS115]CAY67700.1 Hypothetical protein PAS_chr1-1_0325 [Komagataella phaffii GS115]
MEQLVKEYTEATTIDPREIENSLKFYETQFEKLGFQYLEQESKEKFLRIIINENPKLIDNNNIVQLEKENSQVKDNIDEVDSKIKTQVKELDQLGASSIELANKVSQKSDQISQTKKELQQMEQELQELAEYEGVEKELGKYIEGDIFSGLEMFRDQLNSKQAENDERNEDIKRLQRLLKENQDFYEDKKKQIQQINSEIKSIDQDIELDTTLGPWYFELGSLFIKLSHE